jgi:putative transposase
MPRSRIPIDTSLPLHITVRCSNKEWFPIPMNEAWNLFTSYLFFVHHAFNIEIYSYILMQNHFHLILRAPAGNLSEAMMYLNREFSRALGRDSKVINHVFGNRFKPCLLNSNIYFLNAYKYLYRNSVKAGVCKRVEDYPYSSLPGLLGRSRCEVPLVEDSILFANVEKSLDWLNTSYVANHEDEMRRALRHKIFRGPRTAGARASAVTSAIL